MDLRVLAQIWCTNAMQLFIMISIWGSCTLRLTIKAEIILPTHTYMHMNKS